MDNQYLDVFIDEAREHLQTMNQNLIDLEQSPEDRSILDSLFRVAHTLKGMAATMGYQGVANYTHKLENILDSFRQGEKKITSNIIDLLLEGADALEEFVNKLSEGEQVDLDFSSMQSRLEQAFAKADRDSFETPSQAQDTSSTNNEQSKGEAEMAATSEVQTDSSGEKAGSESDILDLNEYEGNLLKSALNDDYSAYHIRVVFDENVLLKGARAFMVFQKVEARGEIIKSDPEVEEIEDENFDQEIELIVVTKVDQQEIKSDIEQVSEINEVYLKVLQEDQLTDKTDEGADEDDDEKVQTEEQKVQQKDKQDEAKDSDGQSQQKIKTGKTVRVDIERLDKLMNLVSELVINKTRLEQVANNKESSELGKTSEQFSRITSEIQNVVMKVRMVPLDQVFNRFPRMVRDLSRSLNKEVNLVIEGRETELDRSLIDEIGDLLMHLIRNALDHGLEDSETRHKSGKSAKGNIHIKAYHNENNVVIEVSDDGKGIDPEKVRKKAISRGLLDSQQSEQVPDSEVINFLFTPGFSTSDEVSEVSGRGVGLDVVKSKLENLGGRVELDSEINQGTKFTMYLPLTLAIIQALMVNVGNEQYALPLSSIEETTILTDQDIQKVQEQEVIRLRDQLVPLIDLHDILDVERTENGEQEHAEQERFAIIVRKGDKKAGLIVDELLGQQEVVIKSLGGFLADIKGFTGATILGDGKVALILDVNSLLF
ncbi:chemotaxis protein CheA [Natranaerobius thermophilus]|uniref:Chemotaxis protein CheA n=1 Tax=Natranaerobius thermophilus (strain ATCC BAA-1301 / DSM 18059 / JW/NM-WN-LF) TaxID=457570 RepID=B2A371_NATTJ|nr:chemotaxis protein CheA [Natranaerobius thermophilus]ACB85001.1 CheA signal transduction histidine kinase [Natranaerobius thermophilus JW/NM-WN-LF]